jgi:hypothetical protein
MASSVVLAFDDPDAFYAAIRTAEVKGVVTRRGAYRSELTRIELDRLWMQRGFERLPRVMNVRRSSGRRAPAPGAWWDCSQTFLRNMVLLSRESRFCFQQRRGSCVLLLATWDGCGVFMRRRVASPKLGLRF